MLPFKVVAAVLCDDIRQEQNSKHILIGVYNGGVVVPSFPAQLIICWWLQILPNEVGKFEIDVQLIKDNKDVLVKAGIGIELIAKEWAAMALPKIPIQLHGEGHLQLQMKKTSESDWETIQQFDVRKGDINIMPIHHIMG